VHYKEIKIIWDGDPHEVIYSTRVESEVHQQQLRMKKTKHTIKKWYELKRETWHTQLKKREE
jgi:hypothetical protein